MMTSEKKPLKKENKPLYTDGDMDDPIKENDPLEAHKRTMNSWTMMQASYAVIREKRSTRKGLLLMSTL